MQPSDFLTGLTAFVRFDKGLLVWKNHEVSEAQLNPFRPAPGSEPPYLVGRDTEIFVARQATAMTKVGAPSSPVIITGLRGMGKTVLLRRAAAEARADGGIVISAEANRREPLAQSLQAGLEQAQATLASVPDRLRQTMGKVVRSLPKVGYELPNDGGEIALSGSGQIDALKRFPVVLRELNEQAHKHGRYLMFAIDEIQEAPIEDLTSLVIFVHETAGTSFPVLLIGAGLQNARSHLHEVRTYTERWDFLEIGLLDSRQTQDAILKPIRDARHAIDQRALQTLAEESGGYPFFVQEYGSAAWIKHVGTTIEFADVNAIVPAVRKKLELRLYDAQFKRLTPRECAYVLALADLGEGAHAVNEVAERLGAQSAQVSSIRNQLVKKDILFVPNGGMVEFRIPLTERYVADHRSELMRRASAKHSLALGRQDGRDKGR